MSNEFQPAEREPVSSRDQKNFGKVCRLQVASNVMPIFIRLLHVDTSSYNCKYEPQVVRPNCINKSHCRYFHLICKA